MVSVRNYAGVENVPFTVMLNSVVPVFLKETYAALGQEFCGRKAISCSGLKVDAVKTVFEFEVHGNFEQVHE